MAVKSLAELVREHRASLGLNAAEYARLVGTSRQNINNVEAGEAEQPRYIGKLAKAMGRTVDELLSGKGAPGAHLAMQDAGRYITPAQALPIALDAIARAPDECRTELGQVLGLLATTGAASYAERITQLLFPAAARKTSLDASAQFRQQVINPEPAAPQAKGFKPPSTPLLSQGKPPDKAPRRSASRSGDTPTPDAKDAHK